MMQSPDSDSGPSSPPSPPLNKDQKFPQQLASTPDRLTDSSDKDSDLPVGAKPILSNHQITSTQQKFVISPGSNKENTIRALQLPPSLPILPDPHHHIIYPRPSDLIESSAKFSIERLKQLADHNITRLSPAREGSTDGKYSIDHTINSAKSSRHPADDSEHPQRLSPQGSLPMMSNGTDNRGQAIISPVSTVVLSPTVNVASGTLSANVPMPFGIKYLAANHLQQTHHSVPTDFDVEQRLKFARAAAIVNNGKELSEFGFRIQLSSLQSNYARSDTSEELNVDGNDDSSQDGNSVG